MISAGRCDDGVLRFQPTEAGRAPLDASLKAEVTLLAAEQSNSLLTIGDVAMLKIYRRILPDEHPEAEMERYLTEAGFTHAPPLLGHVIRIASDGTPFTLGTALGFVRNEGDAWSWILDHLSRALHLLTPATGADIPESDLLSDCEAIVAAIGMRLGELHAILSHETSHPAFAPKVADASDAANWARNAEERIQIAFDACEGSSNNVGGMSVLSRTCRFMRVKSAVVIRRHPPTSDAPHFLGLKRKLNFPMRGRIGTGGL